MFQLPTNQAILLTLTVIAILLLLPTLRARMQKRFRELNDQTRDKMVGIVSATNEFVPVDAASVEGLNLKKLQEYSASLEQLGFTRLLDYRLRRGGNPELRGFERVFVHATQHCFAAIMAAGALRPDQPLNVAVNSYMESGWRLGTSNIPAGPADYYLRQPRILRMRYPDDSTERLFSRHLERRAEILRDLEIRVLADTSIEFYFARVRESIEQAKTKVQGANPLGDLPLAKAQATARNQEWLGDYPAEAKRLRAQKSPLAT